MTCMNICPEVPLVSPEGNRLEKSSPALFARPNAGLSNQRSTVGGKILRCPLADYITILTDRWAFRR